MGRAARRAGPVTSAMAAAPALAAAAAVRARATVVAVAIASPADVTAVEWSPTDPATVQEASP